MKRDGVDERFLILHSINCCLKEYEGDFLKEVPLTPLKNFWVKNFFGVAFAHPKVFLYPHGGPCPIYNMENENRCPKRKFFKGDARGLRPLAS